MGERLFMRSRRKLYGLNEKFALPCSPGDKHSQHGIIINRRIVELARRLAGQNIDLTMHWPSPDCGVALTRIHIECHRRHCILESKASEKISN